MFVMLTVSVMLRNVRQMQKVLRGLLPHILMDVALFSLLAEIYFLSELAINWLYWNENIHQVT